MVELGFKSRFIWTLEYMSYIITLLDLLPHVYKTFPAFVCRKEKELQKYIAAVFIQVAQTTKIYREGKLLRSCLGVSGMVLCKAMRKFSPCRDEWHPWLPLRIRQGSVVERTWVPELESAVLKPWLCLGCCGDQITHIRSPGVRQGPTGQRWKS